jgi:hypothetical protein
VLRVAAAKIGDPVPLVVQMEADNGLLHL